MHQTIQSSAPPTWRDNRRGIIALMLGMALFTANDCIIKQLMRSMPAGEVIFVRGMFTAVMLGAVMAALGHLRTLGDALSGSVLGRAVSDAVSSAFFVMALAHMRIADVSAVLLSVPLILTAAAVLLFGERVGWRRWCAVLVGFAGVLLVVKPTPSGFDAWALVALASAFGSAARDLFTRRIGSGVPTITITFIGAWLVALSGLLMMPGETWRMPAPMEFAALALAAMFLGAATFFIAKAFRGVDISVVSPFRYSLLLFALIAGFLVFGELPDAAAAAGAILIVASGLYVLHRETVRRRAAS
jgi:drug/metabolite transporter (DMT)-like permease